MSGGKHLAKGKYNKTQIIKNITIGKFLIKKTSETSIAKF